MKPVRPLREWRLENGVAQGDLAEKIGISQGYLSNIESGKVTPSLAVALRLRSLTQMDVEKFQRAAQ